MRKRILYLGIDPSRFCCDNAELIHQPLIETVPIQKLPQQVFEVWENVSHLLSTSPRAALHWFSLEGRMDKKVLAIGNGTASKWKERGIDPVVAPFATQEGMIELIQRERPHFVLYPRSAKARLLLNEFLQKTQICHFTFDLYTTQFLSPRFLFPLEEIDQVVFTSPSTVDAFFLLYKTVPQKIEFHPIGPVTKAALEKKCSH